MKRLNTIIASSALLGLLAPVGLADSIAPDTFGATLNVGDSVTIKKTVTVDEGVPTSSKVDVYFLADTTLSMETAINSVKSSAGSILSSTSALGDVAFAVGYDSGEVGDASYGLYQGMTTNTTDVQNAINTWTAGDPSVGGDTPEAQLYGLHHAASDAATGWRAGSERILVWFGDATGHDPSPGGTTPSDGTVTEAQATASLVGAGINVQALNVGYGGLDDDGQATRITAATGGTLYSGIDSSAVAAAIAAAITMAIDEYNTVALDISEVPAGVTVTTSPAHTGDFDRSITRNFGFGVTFTADAPGHYEFPIYGTVDGGRVALEKDRIWVPGTGVPDGGHSVALLGLALIGIGALRKKLCR